MAKMKLRKGEILGLVILFAEALIIVLLYHKLPNELASNWGPDGYPIGVTMHKTKFVIMFLIVMAAIIAVSAIFSRLGKPRPLTKKNQLHYSIFLNFVLLLHFCVSTFTMVSNLKHI